MLTCSVHFYRNVLGLPFSVPRGTVSIRAARDEARAVEAAKRKFARRQGLGDWHWCADHYEVCPAERSRER